MKMNGVNRYWLVAVISLGILLRIGAALYLGNVITGTQQTRIYDQVSYNALASSLLAGQGYSFDKDWYPFTPARTPTAHWSFLYPLYLAGIYKVTGYLPVVARLIQAVICGLLSLWLLFRLGSRLFGEKVGLASAAMGAVYAYFIYHDAALMTESFFVLGVLVMFDLSLQIVDGERKEAGAGEAQDQREGGLKNWIWLGIVLGLLALLRQTIILWVPFLLLWIFAFSKGRSRWYGPVVTLAVMALFILPWTVRNYWVYGSFLPLNSNAGYALYSANHPDHGTNFNQDYAAPLPPDLVGKGLNEAQWNNALTRRGLEFILQDPLRYLLLSLDRVPIFFNFWFSAESDLPSNLMRVLSYGLYLPFYVYGLILSFSRWKRCLLFYLFALIYSLMHILTWASIRYRLPVDMALMPFAALALIDVISRLQAWMGRTSKQSYLPQGHAQ
jgi:4-amino-4-deoxy-L-arabinose transferase-like glycosyltransferase